MTHRPLIALRPLRRGDPPTPHTSDVPAVPARTEGADRAAVRREIASMLADVLYLEVARLDPDAPFKDLGIDSVLGVQFVRDVQGRYTVPINSTALYEYGTLAEFADHVASLLDDSPPVASETPVTGTPSTAAPVRPALAHADVLHKLRERLADVLYCAPREIDVDTAFTSLGLDSVLGVEFVDYVNDTFGVAARTGVLYEQSTLQDLAAWIVAEPAKPTTAPEPTPTSPATAGADGGLSQILDGVLDARISAAEAAELLGNSKTTIATSRRAHSHD